MRAEIFLGDDALAEHCEGFAQLRIKAWRGVLPNEVKLVFPPDMKPDAMARIAAVINEELETYREAQRRLQLARAL